MCAPASEGAPVYPELTREACDQISNLSMLNAPKCFCTRFYVLAGAKLRAKGLPANPQLVDIDALYQHLRSTLWPKAYLCSVYNSIRLWMPCVFKG